jgi:hypothetical protein
MKKVLGLLSVVVMMSSCVAFHGGSIQNSASLSQGNFDYVKKGVTGSATATYILGIGGNAKSKLADEARQDMLSKNPLNSNQALVNITQDVKNSFVLGLFYHTMTYSITADVVEFKK